jgi:flavin reductase (DIM6/NTAB) family NADH-FMN oxidoreductase RutF
LENVVQIHDGHVFDDVMAMLDSPVFVVTTQDGGQPLGCLVSFATQTSVRPRSFTVVLPRSRGTCDAARRSEHLAVHVLAQHHIALAELFDSETGDESDKFTRCSWRGGPNGMPILDDAIAWFVGRTAHWIEIGDHVAYIVEPIAGWAPESDEDVLYLSDLDDLGPGREAPERFVLHKPAAEPRKYGVRFTLDGL